MLRVEKQQRRVWNSGCLTPKPRPFCSYTKPSLIRHSLLSQQLSSKAAPCLLSGPCSCKCALSSFQASDQTAFASIDLPEPSLSPLVLTSPVQLTILAHFPRLITTSISSKILNSTQEEMAHVLGTPANPPQIRFLMLCDRKRNQDALSIVTLLSYSAQNIFPCPTHCGLGHIFYFGSEI